MTPEKFRHLNDESINQDGDNFERNKSKPASCESRSYHSRCTGVWDLYRETRGDDHINPIATSATNWSTKKCKQAPKRSLKNSAATSSRGRLLPRNLAAQNEDGQRGAGTAIYYLLRLQNVLIGTGSMPPRSGISRRTLENDFRKWIGF